MKMNRIYHPYWLWEDYLHRMYETPLKSKINGIDEEERLLKVVECLGNEKTCYKYMKLVIDQWKYACEYRLTNKSLNRIAWLGQCACCLYGGIKQDETKKAWHLLSEEQQQKANEIARKLIEEWEVEHFGQ